MVKNVYKKELTKIVRYRNSVSSQKSRSCKAVVSVKSRLKRIPESLKAMQS